MLIKSTLIARGTFVISEYDASTGNDDLNEVSRKVLPKIPRTGSVRSYVYAGHTFNYLLDKDSIIYLCIADVSTGSESVFQFLRDVRAKFEKISRGKHSADRGSELARMLRDTMGQYNNDAGTTKVKQMEQELEDVTEMMRDNIGKVMERGERIDSLLDKTAMLKSEAVSFRKSAKSYGDQLWWQDARGQIITGIIAFILIVFFYWHFMKKV